MWMRGSAAPSALAVVLTWSAGGCLDWPHFKRQTASDLELSAFTLFTDMILFDSKLSLVQLRQRALFLRQIKFIKALLKHLSKRKLTINDYLP